VVGEWTVVEEVVVVVVVELVVGSGVDVLVAASSEALDCNSNFSMESGVVDGVDQPVNSVTTLTVQLVLIYSNKQ